MAMVIAMVIAVVTIDIREPVKNYLADFFR